MTGRLSTEVMMARHSRRRFLRAGLGLAGLGLLVGCGIVPAPAQQAPKIPRIGVLSVGPREARRPFVDGLEQGLRDHGYVDGQTVAIEWRWSERDEQLPQLARELVQLEVDVIITLATIVTKAAQQATVTIPIVFQTLGDPIANRFAASLARPGANLTGVTGLSPGLTGKRLEILKETVPTVSRVGYLSSSTQLVGGSSGPAEDAARGLGLQLQILDAGSPGELESALEGAVSGRVEALFVAPLPLMHSNRTRIAEFAIRNQLPTMFGSRDYVEAGGLMAYAPNNSELSRRLGAYVDKILRGAKPADLPVEQPTKFDLVINLKAAGALGLTIPPSILQQATEVIQ